MWRRLTICLRSESPYVHPGRSARRTTPHDRHSSGSKQGHAIRTTQHGRRTCRARSGSRTRRCSSYTRCWSTCLTSRPAFKEEIVLGWVGSLLGNFQGQLLPSVCPCEFFPLHQSLDHNLIDEFDPKLGTGIFWPLHSLHPHSGRGGLFHGCEDGISM